MTPKILLKKEYSGESIIDAEEDVRYAIEESNLPVDAHGFTNGTFTITMTWTPEEN